MKIQGLILICVVQILSVESSKLNLNKNEIEQKQQKSILQSKLTQPITTKRIEDLLTTDNL